MKFLFLAILYIGLGFTTEKADGLKVLEFESHRELTKYMKSVAGDLGVKCQFCHDLNDKSIETPHKKIAREMMRMQKNLNESFFVGLADSMHTNGEIATISCWTCHRGAKHPEQKNTRE